MLWLLYFEAELPREEIKTGLAMAAFGFLFSFSS